MQITKVHLIAFSPCGHTLTYGRQMAQACADACGLSDFGEINLTPHASMGTGSFTGAELVLLCSPVYGGRIPGVAIEKFRRLNAQAAPSILIATYGNRHYDDALLEFMDLAEECGFWPTGAAACIAQHTLDPECAAGRPTQADLGSAKQFASEVTKRLAEKPARGKARLSVPGKSPYREYAARALPQRVDESCIMCGQCWINCPTAAIATEEPANVNADRCIACMGCVSICPVKARIPSEQFLQKVAEKLMPLCATPKTNEYFQI